MRWVITRAQPDADADAKALRDAGFDAIAVPCIERVPLPWPDWPQAHEERVIFVTSPFAAMQLIAAWPQPARVAAMAPITTARLRASGVPVAVEAEGGAVALAEKLRALKVRLDVLYPTSDAGMRQEEQDEALTILQSFATVTRAAVYATKAPAGLTVPKGEAYVFMSPSAVENAGRDLRPQRVACIGQSTVRRFQELNPGVSPERHASFPAFLAALRDAGS